jgi:hypothetical protein
MSAKCQLLRIEGVAWSAQRIPKAVNLHFLDPEPLLFHWSSSSVILTRMSRPRSRSHYFSENVVASGIEPGISGSVASNSEHYTTEAVSVYLYACTNSILGTNAIFWDLMPYSLVLIYWRFGGTYCLHLHGGWVSQASSKQRATYYTKTKKTPKHPLKVQREISLSVR